MNIFLIFFFSYLFSISSYLFSFVLLINFFTINYIQHNKPNYCYSIYVLSFYICIGYNSNWILLSEGFFRIPFSFVYSSSSSNLSFCLVETLKKWKKKKQRKSIPLGPHPAYGKFKFFFCLLFIPTVTMLLTYMRH